MNTSAPENIRLISYAWTAFTLGVRFLRLYPDARDLKSGEKVFPPEEHVY